MIYNFLTSIHDHKGNPISIPISRYGDVTVSYKLDEAVQYSVDGSFTVGFDGQHDGVIFTIIIGDSNEVNKYISQIKVCSDGTIKKIK